jgi:hypothetical protein
VDRPADSDVTPAGSAGVFKFSGAGGIDRERPLSYSGACWERLLFSLLGFLLVRSLCVRRWCPASPIFFIKKEVPM